MRDRYPGLVLLLWFPAVLLVSAQTAERPCQPPVVEGGFVIPPKDENETYDHNQTVSYSCDNGQKPAVEGWWAMITCVNGEWSAEPKCIDESYCVQPAVVPNTRYSQSKTGWYENGGKIQIRCDKGYETNNNVFTATCINGDWRSMPVCERSADSCSEPPQIPHTVINQTYQEMFAVDSEVMYQCEDGYTTEQGDTSKSVSCIKGNWTEAPTCKQSDTGPMTKPKQSDTGPMIRPVSNCGHYPHVPNSAVMPDRMALTYSCADHYKLTGPATVVCYSDGSWSELPTCEAEGHCVLDPDKQPWGHFLPEIGVQIVPEGETRYFRCSSNSQYTRGVKCKNGRLTVARYCCTENLNSQGTCW